MLKIILGPKIYKPHVFLQFPISDFVCNEHNLHYSETHDIIFILRIFTYLN